jgi:hypothetical protein
VDEVDINKSSSSEFGTLLQPSISDQENNRELCCDTTESICGSSTAPQQSEILDGHVSDTNLESTGGNKAGGEITDQVYYEYRCKICKLAKCAPKLYKHLHKLVLCDHVSLTVACADANTYLTQNNMGIKHINMVNMCTHFNKHINIKQRVSREIVKADKNQINATPIESIGAVNDVSMMATTYSHDATDDFRNLDDLRQRLMKVIITLEDQLDSVDPETKELKLDRWSVKLYSELIAESRVCISDLNKMKQSERLMNAVIQQLLERMTFAIIPQLMEEYKIVVEELQHANVPENTIMMIDGHLRLKTAQIIAQTARAAVIEIQRQYKIK